MADKTKWMDRFMRCYVEETQFDVDEDNKLKVRTHAGIAQIAALRCAGLDPRKIAMFAADAFRYVFEARKKAVEDVARIALKETQKEIDKARASASKSE